MRWSRGGTSANVEDRRGAGAGVGGRWGSPAGSRLALPRGRLGIAVLVVLLLLGVCFGGRGMLSGGAGGFDIGGSTLDGLPRLPGRPDRSADSYTAERDGDAVAFVSFVLDDVQQSWAESFRDAGATYEPARLVLFEGAVDSACGSAGAAMGPFYCGADERVYLDLGFFRELSDRFGAPGDFAEAYVIAHEIGHHVQHLRGVSDRVHAMAERYPDDANELSVRLELQADCLAGVWASTTFRRELLEEGDLEEALRAASSIGDDRIQRQAGGDVDPESFTHGSSQQRMDWFLRGFDTGDATDCDTFVAGHV